MRGAGVSCYRAWVSDNEEQDQQKLSLAGSVSLGTGVPSGVRHQSLIITAGLAIFLADFLDLSQIASMGVVLYLTMDIAIHWGVIRQLRNDINARPLVPDS